MIMNLEYKPDWEKTKQHYLAWWQHEYFGRCCLWVTAPKEKAKLEKKPPPPSDVQQRWTDLGYLSALNHYTWETTFYGGESFPVWHGGYPGHTAIPTFLGCPVHLDQRTGWWEPILKDSDWDCSCLKINEEGKWWQFTLQLLHRAVVDSQGKAIPSIGAFGGAGDTLAALRGTEQLLYDLSDCPEKVARAEEFLMEMWIQVYSIFYEIVSPGSDGGSTCWFPLWAPGKFYASQCDFSYLISPSHFQKIFLPVIEKQIEYLDYAVFHVDGVGAFRHVPALCQLPKLKAIQILPGAGKLSPLHYLSILQYVQAHKKNLHLTLPCEEVKLALDCLSARGLFIATSCSSEEEAKLLLKQVEKWSRVGG